MQNKSAYVLIEWIKLLSVTMFAMWVGAACYHQCTINSKSEERPVIVETVEKELEVDPGEWEPIESMDKAAELETIVEDTAEEIHETDIPYETEEEIQEEEYFDDLELLAATVEAEAGNQGLIGKRMVAAVILNRVEDSDWPNTIELVVKQKNQFAVWSNGSAERVSISEETYEACRMELSERGWPGIYYFNSKDYSKYGTPWKKVGDHYFSTK